MKKRGGLLGYRVVDSHAHFLSRRFLDAAAAKYHDRTGGDASVLTRLLGWELPPADPVDLGRQWVATLDRHGIARIVLFSSVPGDEADLARAVRAFPGRLAGYALVNPIDAEAAGVAARAISDLGLAGLKLLPSSQGYHAYDTRAYAVYRVAQAFKVPVVLHFGLARSAVARGLGRPIEADLRFANPLDLQPAARDFPDVSFIVPHFGGGFFRETLLLCAQCPNVFVDTSGANVWINYAAHRFDLKQVFARAIEALGPERLIFGTDSTFFPRGFRIGILNMQMEILKALGLAPADVSQILGGNIERLLGMSARNGRS